MKLLLIITLLFTPAIQDNFYGVAENPHHIVNSNGEGYYIEENLNIHEGDTVVIVNNEVYTINCTH